MNNKKTIKQILIALGVAVLALMLYAFMSGSFKGTPAKQGGLISTTGKNTMGQIGEDKVTIANAQILKVLGSIKDIQLNDDIFSNPLFRELKDTRFTIPRPVRIGRPNPFASIGVEFLNQNEDMQGGQDTVQGGTVETVSFFDETTSPETGGM